MHKIAVIGPLGSGKSEIMRICAELDYPTVSADHIAKMLLELPGIAHDDVVKEFPTVLDGRKKIDRYKLAKLVFSNHERLKKLESIIHPHVWQIVASFFMECENKNEEICFVEVSAPDATISTRFDEMWCSVAPKDIRKHRCLERGMSEEDFEVRDEFQSQNINFEALCTRTIDNSGSVEELKVNLSNILSELTETRGKSV